MHETLLSLKNIMFLYSQTDLQTIIYHTNTLKTKFKRTRKGNEMM